MKKDNQEILNEQMNTTHTDQNDKRPSAGREAVFPEEIEEDVIDEDEMIVADMSLVRKRSIFLPERIRHQGRLDESSGGGISSQADPLGRSVLAHKNSDQGYSGYYSPYGGTELSKEETKWAILGTLKAALLIAGVYGGGLGLLILLMVTLFKYFG